MQNLSKRRGMRLLAAVLASSLAGACSRHNSSWNRSMALRYGAGEVQRGYRSTAKHATLQAHIPTTRYALNDFAVEWDAATAQLRLTRDGVPVAASVPGEPFVAAQQVESGIVGEHGDYNLLTDVSATLQHQSVETILSLHDAVEIGGHLSGDGSTWAYSLHIARASDSQLAVTVQLRDAPSLSPSSIRTVLKLQSDPTEEFYGFGAQTQLSQKGRVVPILVREQGHGRGLQPRSYLMNMRYPGIAGTDESAYAPVPFYVTSAAHGTFLENTEVSLFDLRAAKRVEISVIATQLRARLIAAKSVPEVVQSFTEYTGRQQPLPAWINGGAIIGMQGGTQRVRSTWAELQTAQVPVAAFWLQDWEGPRRTPNGIFLQWNWVLSDSTYPQFKTMVADLRKSGIRTMTYFNSFLARDLQLADGAPNYYAQAAQQHLLVQNSSGDPYEMPVWQGVVGLLDLSNPATRTFIKNILKDHMQTLQISGWMGDFGEALPFDGHLQSGTSPWAFHNAYAEAWAQVQHEAVQELNLQDEVVFFNRSGFTRSPSYTPLFWLGDQMVDWDAQDGLKTVIPMLLTSGLSGFAINHGDIGGYLGVDRWPLKVLRSKELFMRWAELAAFTAVFRTHEGSQPQGNHQFNTDSETLAHFAHCAQVYASLKDYRTHLFEEATHLGHPLVRPMFFHYPQDPETPTLDRQFMLGSDLVVAPVLSPGETTVNVYLPAGTWRPFFGGETLTSETGRWVIIDAPLGRPGVFIRGESSLKAYAPS